MPSPWNGQSGSSQEGSGTVPVSAPARRRPFAPVPAARYATSNSLPSGSAIATA